VSEFDLIARIADILGSPGPGVELGIGDDAAVLSPSSKRSVVTVDAAVEGVHFRRDWMDLEDIGYRATVTAASDILAMGATPRAAVAAWTIPPDVDDDTVCAIVAGQREAALLLGMSIVGGNITSGPLLSITTTVIGEADGVLTRSGARPGDVLVVAGVVGEAALGIAALQRGRADVAERAVRAYRRPRVLLEESRALAATAHAMIDISDGLAQDLGHVAQASGVRVVIVAEKLLADPSIEEAARALSVDLDELMLCGGDDYALVAAMPNNQTYAGTIGYIEAGGGVVVERENHRASPPAGYTHR
jgi:thiamine-monophosphate kinase